MAWRRGFRGALASLALSSAIVAGGSVDVALASDGNSSEITDGKPRTQAPASVRRVAGPNVRLAANGLWRVEIARGPDLFTHGPDPAPPSPAKSRLASDAPGGVGFDPGDPERAPVCADELNLQVLYARPATAPDRLAEVHPQLQAAVRRMNAVLDAESLASGGPHADYRVRCDDAGELSVEGIVASGSSFSEIVAAARAQGFGSSQTEYLIFYDGSAGGACGIGSYRADERLRADNVSNQGGGYGIAYSDCWFNETPMHESSHSMGAVQYGAPHSTGDGGHCVDEVDVMCYSPDGGDLNQAGTTTACPGAPRFDCGFDDYFDSAPEPGEYLETHWNLGSPLNRFLSFSAAGTTAAPSSAPDAAPATSESLGDGGKTQDASGTPGEWRYFELRVPRRTKLLRVRIFAAPNANLALFVRHKRKATRGLFECRETLRNRHATCRIEEPEPGRWYAGVITRGGTPGLAYKLRAKVKRERAKRR